MKNLISLVALIAYNSIFGQVSLDYYLEADHPYDQSIPQPQTLLGYAVGTWHVSHDKLVHYMHRLAESSDRIQIENRGSTYEGRTILLLTITSPENHSRIEEIKSNHIALTESGADQISIEAPFFGKNVQSMLKLGRAQGVAIASWRPITPKKESPASGSIVRPTQKHCPKTSASRFRARRKDTAGSARPAEPYSSYFHPLIPHS